MSLRRDGRSNPWKNPARVFQCLEKRSPGSSRSWTLALSLLLAVCAGRARAQTDKIEALVRNDLTFRLEAGSISYEENLTIFPIDSDWDAAMALLGVNWEPVLAPHFSVILDGATWGSTEETEEWTEDSRLRQRNDLFAGGLDLFLGFGFPFGVGTPYRIKPYAGFGYSYQSFERSDFVLYGPGGSIERDPGSVEEEFFLVSVAAGVTAEAEITESWTLVTDARFTHVVDYDADNSDLGDVNGDGGDVVDLGAGVRWRWKPGRDIYAGLRAISQDLEGDTEIRLFEEGGSIVPGTVELPDNELVRITGVLALRLEI